MQKPLLLALLLSVFFAAQSQTAAGEDSNPTTAMVERAKELDDARLEAAKKIIAAMGETEQQIIKTADARLDKTSFDVEADLAVATAQTQAQLDALGAHKKSAAMIKEMDDSLAADDYLSKRANSARKVADLFAVNGANEEVTLKKARDIKAEFGREMNAAEEAKQPATATSAAKQAATKKNEAAVTASFAVPDQTKLHLTNWTFTNLQGQVFPNVTVSAVSVDSIIVFWDGGGAKVYFTNLPENIRTMFHYDPANAAAASVAKQQAARKNQTAPTDALDIFLAQHQNSEFSVHTNINWYPTNQNRSEPQLLLLEMFLYVTPKGFLLRASKMGDGSAEHPFVDDGEMQFKFGQEKIAAETFAKFLEWEAVAAASKAETLKKPLARYPEAGSPLIRSFGFQWDAGNDQARLDVDIDVKDDYDNIPGSLEGITNYFAAQMNTVAYRQHFYGDFNKIEITKFQKLLPFLPELKQELAEKLKRQDAQTNLFK